MTKHFIETRFLSGMNFDANINDHHVSMDTVPPEGNNLGPSPKRLMLASLAGCTGIDIVSILNKMKVDFTDFSISVEGTLTETHPKVYNHVMITYSIRLDQANQVKMEKAIKLSQEKYCGVNAMFRAFAVVESKVNYL